jgi:hypothetical protein
VPEPFKGLEKSKLDSIEPDIFSQIKIKARGE